MLKEDLHDVFIDELNRRIPHKGTLVNYIMEVLALEKEPVYRRLAGKVNFTIREMGILSRALNMSLDSLVYRDEDLQWLPQFLESPSRFESIDTLCDALLLHYKYVSEVSQGGEMEVGSIYSTLPLMFYVNIPILLKYMLFRWGYYFVRSDEFENFGHWTIPEAVSDINIKYKKLNVVCNASYIWDSSMIMTLVREINNFHRMNIVSSSEREEIKRELKQMLYRLEKTLNGTLDNPVGPYNNFDFYISSVNVGITSGYMCSPGKNFAMYLTNFSFSMITDSGAGFTRIREWIDSLRSIGTQISGSGRLERKIFFETQYKIIEEYL